MAARVGSETLCEGLSFVIMCHSCKMVAAASDIMTRLKAEKEKGVTTNDLSFSQENKKSSEES